MKRIGYLLESVADIDNLRLAYWKAQRGKTGKIEVVQFAKNLDQNLLVLREQILSNTLTVGSYHYFKIFDPKERNICAASFHERVLHHALMNSCHTYFERVQIFDSYASRIGKGTYKALERAQQFTKKYQWFLKLDFSKYFDSIEHNVLKNQLVRLFKDPYLLAVFFKIIDSYEVSPMRGVPIGNLTSQYFANHYLTTADHFAKEVLRVPAYVRYMDDIVMWHNDKEVLMDIEKRFAEFTSSRLLLTLKPSCLNKSSKGLPFLSYLLYPTCILLAQRSRSRFSQKIKKYFEDYQSNKWSERELKKHLLPLVAFTEQADAVGFRAQVLRAVNEGY